MKTTSHSDRGHAPLAPSAAHRWSNCAGSVRHCAPIPNKSTPAADEGTAGHMLAERCLMENRDAIEFIGTQITVRDGVVFNVDEEMVDGVQTYVDFVLDLFKGDGEKGIEQQLDITHIHPKIWGTTDAYKFLEKTGELHVADFKFGKYHAVEPEENPQGILYASGVARKFGDKVKKIFIHIVQPRAAHPRGPIRTWETNPFWLEIQEDRLADAAEATDREDAPFTAGEWCKYCPGAATCETLRKRSLDIALDEFDDPVEPEQMPPEKLASVLSEIDMIEGWIKRVREYALARAMDGEPPAGWKLVAKRAMRRWRNPDDAGRNITTMFDLVDDEIYTRKIISPAQVEKLIPKNQRAALSELVEKKSSGVTLAPNSDPREAVKPDAASEFEDVET